MTTIVLDPGHGGDDSGAVHGSFSEKDFNLQIALRTRYYLRKNYDVAVGMTRTTDRNVSLQARTDFANQANADYFCSIHVNAGGGNGWESYIYNGSTVLDKTIAAQQTIHEYVLSQLREYDVADRGMKRANFHVLRETRMPAILLENLFLDAAADLNRLRNDTFINRLGDAIGEGLAKALSLRSSSANTALYRIIAGSFTSRTNAERRRNSLKQNGVDAFLVQRKIGGRNVYRVQAGAFRDQTLATRRLNEVRSLGIKDAFITTR